jgi:hypothetical protein
MSSTRGGPGQSRRSEPLQDFLDSRDVVEEVLTKLDPTSLTFLRRVSRGFKEAVDASSLPRAGGSADGDARLETVDFFGTVERISWAKANGSPWDDRRVVFRLARYDEIYPAEVLKWAVGNGAPSGGTIVCDRFAMGGDLVGLYNSALYFS